MNQTPIPQIRMVPIEEIEILNPRTRNQRIFNELVASIAHLGLKKPITVSIMRDSKRFNLVCGQGRLEAFVALGQKEIPAIVIEASEEDCHVMSLVENLARRNHKPLELIREITGLRERGYTYAQIATKIDFSPEYVGAICYLFENGEERLVQAVERGTIPHSIAIEIARAKDGEIQNALADAYEKKTLPGNQILTVRRIVEQRNVLGKSINGFSVPGKGTKKPVTAEILVRSYRKETERQKLLLKRATVAQSRLLFVVNALRRLLADETFVSLLRAESMLTLPLPLAQRVEEASAVHGR